MDEKSNIFKKIKEKIDKKETLSNEEIELLHNTKSIYIKAKLGKLKEVKKDEK